MRGEEGAAQPRGQRHQRDTGRAALGIEQHRQPQPEQQNGVGQRQGQQRPVEPEEAGHGAGVQGAQPAGVSTSGVPAASHTSRRPAATISAARVRATFSSVVLSARPQAA